MEIPDTLRSLFSTQVEQRDGSYVVEVPESEVQTGAIRNGTTYRVALLPARTETATADNTHGETTQNDTTRTRESSPSDPPVEEGETRRVEIEDIGDQGDGITRVERGFVVIVPDTEKGERVSIEITDVQENVAFAEVTDRDHYVE